MAAISPEEYDRRRESAARRMAINAEVTSLTSTQHEIIEEVCTMRHKLHCSDDELYNGESLFCKEATTWLDNINSRLIRCCLPRFRYMPAIENYPTAEDRYCGLIDDSEEEENKEKFYSMMNELNSSIEEWLRAIDDKHGTHYAPTGAQRM